MAAIRCNSCLEVFVMRDGPDWMSFESKEDGDFLVKPQGCPYCGANGSFSLRQPCTDLNVACLCFGLEESRDGSYGSNESK
jgi:hypothetical protein